MTARPRNKPRHRRISRASLVVVSIIATSLMLFHAALLTAAHGILVVDQSARPCRYGMLVSPGPECYDATARLLAGQSFQQVLIADQKPRRSVVVGAMPPLEDRIMAELVARGIDRDQMRVINTQAETPHQMFRQSDRLVRQQQQATVLVISTETKSRYFRRIIDQALPPERASQYRVRAIRSPQATATTWWRSRGGIRQVMVHGLRLIFVCCFGQSEVEAVDPYGHLVTRDRGLRPESPSSRVSGADTP